MTDPADPRFVVVATLMVVGLAFDLVGCIGLLRLPDVYNRLQAGTKCVTLGTLFILAGVVAWSGLESAGVKALLCLWFVAITSPTAAHALARGAHRAGVPLWRGSVVDRYAEDREGRAAGDLAEEARP